MTRSSMSCAALALTAALVLDSFGARAAPGDVDCDSCVDSKDLADAAVTTPKIADQAVTTGKIAPGAVTGGELATGAVGPVQLQDGAVTAAKLQDSSVGTTAIQGSAVTSAKIASGAVTADKLDPGISLGGSELLRTIVVSPVGPTAADNCDELLAALNGITDNGQDNSYLIKIEPGIYDCGATQVFMKPFVDMEGSGTSVTKIVGNPEGSTSSTLLGGVVVGAANTELRQLTVEHIGGTQLAAAIVIDGTVTRITDVDVRADGTGTNFAAGLVIADTLEPTLVSDVRVTQVAGLVTGIVVTPNSVFTGTTRATLDGIVVRTFSALSSGGAQTIIRNSALFGSVSADNFIASAVVSTLVSGLVGGAGLRCIGSYDESFAPLDGACLPISAP